jgi:hypothetical protein
MVVFVVNRYILLSRPIIAQKLRPITYVIDIHQNRDATIYPRRVELLLAARLDCNPEYVDIVLRKLDAYPSSKSGTPVCCSKFYTQVTTRFKRDSIASLSYNWNSSS